MSDSRKLDIIIEKLGVIDSRVEALDSRVESLDKKVESLDKKVESLEGRVDSLDKKVESLDKKVVILDNKVTNADREIRLINLKLENEVSRNISIVAENHLDLSRKLNEVIHITSDIKAKYEIVEILLNQYQTTLREKTMA
ncbi:MAG: hypothetical protein ACK5LL_07130 [Suipraeoptans sp.]